MSFKQQQREIKEKEIHDSKLATNNSRLEICANYLSYQSAKLPKQTEKHLPYPACNFPAMLCVCLQSIIQCINGTTLLHQRQL
jgi:hypothetical protein